jgi:hypothetical protein
MQHGSDEQRTMIRHAIENGGLDHWKKSPAPLQA